MLIKKFGFEFDIDQTSTTYKWWEKNVINGHWEEDVWSIFKKYANKEKDVLDIGAWNGVHSIALSYLFRKVHSFEPDPKAYNDLVLNTKNRDNICYYNFAVGDYSGIGEIKSACWGNSGTTMIQSPTFAYKTMPCAVISFVDIFEKYKNIEKDEIGLIKIDIEGYEYKMVPTMLSFLSNYKGVLVLSHHDIKLKGNLNNLISSVMSGPFSLKTGVLDVTDSACVYFLGEHTINNY